MELERTYRELNDKDFIENMDWKIRRRKEKC